jgi:thioredoxin reductase (NADPH)
VRHAANVAIATGYYDHPEPLGIPGEELPHVAHYWSEAHAFYRKHVVVVGGKNSAAIAALELYRAGAHVTLVPPRPASPTP